MALFLRARRPPNKTRRSAAGTRAALLAGPSGAGKTTLFLELTKKKNRKNGTVASMTENEGVAAVLSSNSSSSGNNSRNTLRRVPLVDAPGHPRLRALAASRAPAATAIVFVVDSSDFLPRKADAAEALAGLLAGSWRRKSKKGVPVLLACNKSDRGEAAHSPEFIRRRLEKEIEALIASAAMGGLAGEQQDEGGDGGDGGDDGNLASLLRRAGEPFSFAGLAKVGGPSLETCTCSALKGQIGGVSGFLAKHG